MKFFYTIIFTAFVSAGFAQNTSSPYSIIGIGDIEKSNFDRTSGIGHSGLALVNDRFINASNPASYSFLNDKFFNFEVSARYKNINYSGDPLKNAAATQSNDLQFKRVGAAIKLKPRWGLGLGVTPFSNSNYSFFGTRSVQGSGSLLLNTYNEGSGSLNSAYLALSYVLPLKQIDKKLPKPIPTLSFGIQTNFLFGQFQQKESIFSPLSDSVLVTTRNIFYNNPQFKGGLIFNYPINDKWRASFAATGTLKSTLRSQEDLTIVDGQTEIKKTETINEDGFKLPTMFGVGVAATYKNKYTFTADYHRQNWSELGYRGIGYTLTNSERLSAGLQLSNNIDLRGGGSFEKSFLQIGGFYKNTYLNINNQSIKDYGITLGAGIQLFKNVDAAGKLALMGNIEIGTRGTTNAGLIKENYTQFGITLSYRDFWFTNIKRYN